MSHIFPRHTKTSLSTAISGEGCYLIDDKGRRYLDGCCGAAVSCLGHNHPKVIDALKKQLDQLAYAHTSFFTSEPAEKLANRLIQHAPKNLDRVYLVSGGSEAVEASLKLAKQYFLEKGKCKKNKVIARSQSFHGNTLGALSVGGNWMRRKQYETLLIDTYHISSCYPYRGKKEEETDVEYGLRVANQLEEKINELGAENVMAFIAEPVVGATLGAVVATEGYFKRIREICDQYDVLLILDEIMCGMGRVGSLFACDQEGVTPDILCIAKGLGAGYQPIGAMLCSEEIYQAIENGSGFFQHGHTYLGHPMAAAAANAVLDVLLDDEVLNQVTPMGALLNQQLTNHFETHPHVGDIRGRGLFQAIELVADRDTKTPFASDLDLTGKIKVTAKKNGLLCYPISGTIDGEVGNHILLAPPFIIRENEIQELVEKLSVSLSGVLR